MAELYYAGLSVQVYRNGVGKLTVDIETSELARHDVRGKDDIPNIRVQLNEQGYEFSAGGEIVVLD